MESSQTKSSILKSTRESKGLTLEIVHEATKIPMDALRAIEEGYSSRILSPFYYRGFIKIYAEFLGLNVADMYREYGIDQPLKPIVPSAATANKPKANRPSTPAPAQPNVLVENLQEGLAAIFKPKNLMIVAKIIGAVVIFVLLVKLAGCAVSHLHKKQPIKKRIIYSAPVVSAKDSDDDQDAAPVEKPAPAPVAVVSHTEEAQSDTGKVEVAVRAMRKTFLQVWCDGNEVFRMTLAKGSLENWTADKKIELSGSHIEQLDMEVNGKHIGPLGGGERRIRRVVITPEGLTVKK